MVAMEGEATNEEAAPADGNYALEIAAAQGEIESEVSEEVEKKAGEIVNLEANAYATDGTNRKVEFILEELREIKAKNSDRETTTKLRSEYAEKAYKLASGCIAFWIVVIGFQGVCFLATGRHPLSDPVLIAITSGCTVNVLAAFLGVIRGLFPSSSRPERDKKGKKGKKRKKSKTEEK